MKQFLTALLCFAVISTFAQIDVDSNGKVGIGTDTPNALLHVNGSAPLLKLQNNQQAYTDIGYFSYITGTDMNGVNTWWIGEGSSNAKIVGLYNSQPDYLLNVYNNGAGISVRPNGHVGIGLTNPSHKLDVFGATSTPSTVGLIRVGSSGNSANLRLGVSTNYSWMQSHGSLPLHINKVGNNTFINADSGNVGIGTETPTVKLNVKTNNNSADATILKLDNSGTAGNVTGLEFFASATDSNTSNRVGRIEGAFDGGSFINARLSFYSMDSGNTLLETLTLKQGNVGIGTTDTFGRKLAVNGDIAAKDLIVENAVHPWPDYVFESDYRLLPLEQVEQHIEKEGHLPNVPSAKEIEEKGGFSVEHMNKKLLEKVEELTLYLIEQNKQLKELNQLKERVKLLEKELEMRKK
jgi:hypothetical protein